jgi:hypothetical protein
MENSIMYGSGSCGITTRNVESLKCMNSIIRGCTEKAFSLDYSIQIEFEKCEFSDNNFYDLFRIYTCNNVSLNTCVIENNHCFGGEYHTSCGINHYEYNSAFHSIFDVNESSNISISNCEILNNEACFLMNESKVIEMKNCKIENNEFRFGNFFNK